MLCGAGGHAIARMTGQTSATTTPGIAIESKQQFSLIGGGTRRSFVWFGRCAAPASSLLKVITRSPSGWRSSNGTASLRLLRRCWEA